MLCVICVGDKVFEVFLQMMAEKVSRAFEGSLSAETNALLIARY